jgi:hypothetical protein
MISSLDLNFWSKWVHHLTERGWSKWVHHLTERGWSKWVHHLIKIFDQNEFITWLNGVDQNDFITWSKYLIKMSSSLDQNIWSKWVHHLIKIFDQNIWSKWFHHRLDVPVKWLCNSNLSLCLLHRITGSNIIYHQVRTKSYFFDQMKFDVNAPSRKVIFFDLVNFELSEWRPLTVEVF